MAALTGRFATELSGLSLAAVFALVADVERYPDFLPWCRAIRVVAGGDGWREVDNHFRAGPVDLRFRSRAEAREPHRLDIVSEDGPFRRLRLEWRFAEHDGGVGVELRYHVALRSALLQGLVAWAWPAMERRIVARFRARAASLAAAASFPPLSPLGREC